MIFEEQVKTGAAEFEKIKRTTMKRQVKLDNNNLRGGGNQLVPSAIGNPKTNKLLVYKDEIKEVTLRYCIDTLTSNKPEYDFKKVINEKKIFLYKIKKIKRSGNANYDFLTL